MYKNVYVCVYPCMYTIHIHSFSIIVCLQDLEPGFTYSGIFYIGILL